MTDERRWPTGEIFAIDIGATSIKFSHVDRRGELLAPVKRRATPYPCSPGRLVRLVALRVAQSGSAHVGVGFPGELVNGRVVHPGNLARVNGIGSEVDEAVDREWRGFALPQALRDATGQDVRVVNDATLAALGCGRGPGRELVVTLGSGFGLALVIDGTPVAVRDVGEAPFDERGTFDEVLGEQGRAQDEALWRRSLRRAIAELTEEFDTTKAHLAGGNARRVSPSLFEGLATTVAIHGNEVSLRGAARLFYP